MWHTSLFSTVGGVSFIPKLLYPWERAPPISFTRQTDLKAGVGVVNGEIPSYFSNKNLIPQLTGLQLG
jgi:hypothetical protein